MNNAIRLFFYGRRAIWRSVKLRSTHIKMVWCSPHRSCVEWRGPSRCACFTLEHSQKGRSNKNGNQTQKKNAVQMSFTIFLLRAARQARWKTPQIINQRGRKTNEKTRFFFRCENDSWKFVFNWRVFSGLLPHLQCLFCERPRASVQHTWWVNRHLASRWQWLMVDKNGMEIPQLVLLVWWSLAASVRPPKWIYRNARNSDIRHISVTSMACSAYGWQWTRMNWTNVHLFCVAWRGNALRQIPLRRTSHSIWI